MTHPKKGGNQQEKSPAESLPKKEAAPSVNAETAHEDSLLDEALDETFPASDPIELHAESKRTQEDVAVEHEEQLLDEALDETFPASDPIAPDHHEKAATKTPASRPGR